MDRLFSPWRSKFVTSEEARSHDPQKPGPFETAWREVDRDNENLMLYRGRLAFILLNRYPYNAGHLLVVPVRVVAGYPALRDEERHEIADLTDLGIRILEHALLPDGFNVGMNLGRTAGAAIDYHVHVHIVPRWNGDTNFMPVAADTRVISESMTETFNRLKSARDQILRQG